MDEISLVIVNYNGLEQLKMCCRSILNVDYPQEKIETIVVDNGSTDGSLEYLANEQPTFQVLNSPLNNYAFANNYGVAHSSHEYVGLLNNDVELHPNWVKGLVASLNEHINVAVVGGKNFNPDGTLQSTGLIQFTEQYWGDRGYLEPDCGQYDLPERVSGVSNCAAMYRSSLYRGLGGLDTDFENYYEDVDLAIRLHRAGWFALFDPHACATHYMHQTITTSARRLYLNLQNRMMILAKHQPGLHRLERIIVEETLRINPGWLPRVCQAVLKKLYENHPPDVANAVAQQLKVEVERQSPHILHLFRIRHKHYEIESGLEGAHTDLKDIDYKRESSQPVDDTIALFSQERFQTTHDSKEGAHADG